MSRFANCFFKHRKQLTSQFILVRYTCLTTYPFVFLFSVFQEQFLSGGILDAVRTEEVTVTACFLFSDKFSIAY